MLCFVTINIVLFNLLCVNWDLDRVVFCHNKYRSPFSVFGSSPGFFFLSFFSSTINTVLFNLLCVNWDLHRVVFCHNKYRSL